MAFPQTKSGPSSSETSSLTLKLKIRLFLDPLIDTIDPLGVVSPSSSPLPNSSSFRLIMFNTLESIVSANEWCLSADTVRLLSYHSLCVKYGDCPDADQADADQADADRDANIDIDIDHVCATLKRIYYNSSTNVPYPGNPAIVSEWRNISTRTHTHTRTHRRLQSPSSPPSSLTLSYNNYKSALKKSSYYGITPYTITHASNNASVKKIGVSQNGIVYVGSDGCVSMNYDYDYIRKYGFVGVEYFYFFDTYSSNGSGSGAAAVNSKKRGERSSKPTAVNHSSDIKLYTAEASVITSLVHEYTTAIVNVRSGVY
jgi:hypothetical protein